MSPTEHFCKKHLTNSVPCAANGRLKLNMTVYDFICCESKHLLQPPFKPTRGDYFGLKTSIFVQSFTLRHFKACLRVKNRVHDGAPNSFRAVSS